MEEKQIANSSLGQTPPARQRLEFAYDSQSRRVRKVVKVLQDQTWSVKSDLRFMYDSWNLLAEFTMKPGTSNLELLRSYAWGYDLSGSEQGAGGVGGLISVSSPSSILDSPSSSTLAPCYDGNGNILAYLDCESGTVTQRMEYDAFGNEMTLDSVLAGNTASVREVPFRFSTKYADAETNLSYYGYRYYSAEMGRWLSMDPLSDVSFRMTMYRHRIGVMTSFDFEANSMCRNDPVNLHDSDGCIVPLIILAFTTSGYTNAVINACFAGMSCSACVECWNETLKWNDYWYEEAVVNRGANQVFIDYMKSNPGSSCAGICNKCGETALRTVVYLVGSVMIKYGVRRNSGGNGTSLD